MSRSLSRQATAEQSPERDIITIILPADRDGTSGAKAAHCATAAWSTARPTFWLHYFNCVLMPSRGFSLAYLCLCPLGHKVTAAAGNRKEREKEDQQTWGDCNLEWKRNEFRLRWKMQVKCGEQGEKKNKKRFATDVQREEGKNQKNRRTEGALAVTDSKFICKQAMKYDMTKSWSWKNFASTARLCLLQMRGVTASTYRLDLSFSSCHCQ